MIILLSTSHHFMIVLGATGYLHSRPYTAAVASRALGWGRRGSGGPGRDRIVMHRGRADDFRRGVEMPRRANAGLAGARAA